MSYLNRVELQNGCPTLGHSNTFIPSTLSGPNINEETGQIYEAKLRENLSLAITAYISRVNGSPCGDTNIKLYKDLLSKNIISLVKNSTSFSRALTSKSFLCKRKTLIYSHISRKSVTDIWRQAYLQHMYFFSNAVFRQVMNIPLAC